MQRTGDNCHWGSWGDGLWPGFGSLDQNHCLCSGGSTPAQPLWMPAHSAA